MSEYGRLIGVDVGSKRVGLARTDLLKTGANPIGTYSPTDSLEEIRQQIDREGPINGIVVGWPLTPQGDATHATPVVTEYIKKLKKKFPEIQVYKMDERYSSRQALQMMVESGVPKKKRQKKGRLDQAAAALILQEFLEARPEI
ncbi:MAG: Holliday junction resolvase RuvX [Balneolaceae bacterium]